ncbi:MAG TPA: hypothetical protein VNF29_12195 [Candidatus Binataceae bacterium]|nr:hypothetical protein [Candidatus Binataceae bacterium]
MQTTTSRTETRSGTGRGVVYRTTCQNPGCGATFELRITAANASLLGGSMPCPKCRRHGGFLKSQGRIGDKLFAAKLMFRATGVGPSARDDEDLFGDSRY